MSECHERYCWTAENHCKSPYEYPSPGEPDSIRAGTLTVRRVHPFPNLDTAVLSANDEGPSRRSGVKCNSGDRTRVMVDEPSTVESESGHC